jgi:AcrR family transcriptional regulator
MRELARQSGLAKSTIYHHFHDKRDIFLCVLERDLNLAGDRIRQAADMDGMWIDRLRSVVRTYIQLQMDRRPLLLTALREQGEMQVELCELLKKFRARLVEPIADLIQQGIRSGEARPISVEAAVLSLLGIMHGFVGRQLLFDSAPVDPATENVSSGPVDAPAQTSPPRANEHALNEDAVESALQIFLYGIIHENDSR